MSEWISINDRLPEEGEKVIVADAGKGRVGAGTYSALFGWWVNDFAYSGAMPTHWMPLPAPPEVNE